MWVKEGERQVISFIDPHGIRNDSNFNAEKIRLYQDIKETENELRRGKNCPEVKLESLILSVSEFKDIKDKFEDGKREKDEFEERHILFMEDKDVMDKMFQIISS